MFHLHNMVLYNGVFRFNCLSRHYYVTGCFQPVRSVFWHNQPKLRQRKRGGGREELATSVIEDPDYDRLRRPKSLLIPVRHSQLIWEKFTAVIRLGADPVVTKLQTVLSDRLLGPAASG